MRRVGVIGHPIKHSISPVFQQAAFDELDIPARYERFEVSPAELSVFMESVRSEEWLGVNVTIPHKREVVRLVDRLSPEAERIGAVNTVVNQGGELMGHNTDASGFLRALSESDYRVQGQRVVVLGAGGSARAVVAGLCQAGANAVALSGRSTERALALASDLHGWSRGTSLSALGWDSGDLRIAIAGASLLVNTTPIGMAGGDAPDRSPIPKEMLHDRLTVFDLVYNPVRTRLLQYASRRCARVVSGLDMLVHQGAESFEMWTGVPAPVEVMKAKAREALEG